MEVDNQKIRELIKDLRINSPNLIFSAWFYGKDGVLRKIRCRMNVHKYDSGKGALYNPDDYDLIWVCNMDLAKEYDKTGLRKDFPLKSIALSRIERLVINGIEYKVYQ